MGGVPMGWIYGSAVAVGVGIAVGTGCAVAGAEPASVSSSADPSTHIGADQAISAPNSGAADDGKPDRVGDAVATGDVHESADQSPAEREAQIAGDASTGDDENGRVERDDTGAEPNVEDPSGQQNPSVAEEVGTERPAAAVDERTEDAPEPVPAAEPKEPPPVVTVTGAVAAAQPNLSVEEPATPSRVAQTQTQTQTLALPAAARRQEETSTGGSSSVQTVAPVENSLTYTPGPTFLDNLALLFHEAFRLITDLTGVNVYMLIQSLLVSDSPPGFLRYGLDTRRTEYTAQDGAEWDVWEFRPPNPSGKTVIALHGGGWIYQPNLLHWIDYTDMARQTGATVIVPLYPLADTPAGRAEVVIPETADFISHQIELNCRAENVSIYADSAGSSIAMAAVSELVQTGRPVPSSMVLLSMVADTTLQNPAIREVNDPIFNIDKLGGWTSYWPMNIHDPRDPRLSPLFMDDETLRGLPPTTIYVGEREILYPDTLLLYQKAVAAGAPISVVVGTGQIHDWPLSGLAISSQTAAVRPDVFCRLGLNGNCAELT